MKQQLVWICELIFSVVFWLIIFVGSMISIAWVFGFDLLVLMP